MIQQYTFYKAKDEVDGRKTPGGFLFVTELSGNYVMFAAADEPSIFNVKGSRFKMHISDFEKLIDKPVKTLQKVTQ